MLPRRVARRTARRTTRRVARRQGMFNEPETTEEVGTDDTTAELERLFSLKEQGAITQEEYDKKKKELLG